MPPPVPLRTSGRPPSTLPASGRRSATPPPASRRSTRPLPADRSLRPRPPRVSQSRGPDVGAAGRVRQRARPAPRRRDGAHLPFLPALPNPLRKAAIVSGPDLVFVALAAVGAGLVNALAGGGTLITFPALLAVGVPAVAANVTNTVALTPGYLGATLAQARALAGQRARLLLLVPAAVAGGMAGGFLLLGTSERIFRGLVPWLILLASGLLAAQRPEKAWVQRRLAAVGESPRRRHQAVALLPIALAAVYGGYFGAGLSVIILAVLALALDDTLTRLNGLKQALAFATNTSAAVLFVFSGRTVWLVAGVM
ncbi:MAG: sulfite exporter TauE/SafE family protein, partial [Gemmatimonadetes bacterium]|nr:sulfite exporter TauE/SafE family protein [Gemmatimonadota bacterium]